MKMLRYHARDMRQALARIRVEQGPDAVILSTQRTADGVVVCAAVEYDRGPVYAPANESAPQPQRVEAAAPPVDVAPRGGVTNPAAEVVAPSHELVTAAAEIALPPLTDPIVPSPVPTIESPVVTAAAMPLPMVEGEGTVQQEIRSLRHLLESQVAALAWNDFTRRQPMQARVLEELASLGLSRALALEIARELPDALDADQAANLPQALLARRIPVTRSAAFETGGCLALVGPNGVGKTTTLAKLATRWVLERGAQSLALISLDRERFGAQEQLHSLGRVLGVPSIGVEDIEDLPATLVSLYDRRLTEPGLRSRRSAAGSAAAALPRHRAVPRGRGQRPGRRTRAGDDEVWRLAARPLRGHEARRGHESGRCAVGSRERATGPVMDIARTARARRPGARAGPGARCKRGHARPAVGRDAGRRPARTTVRSECPCRGLILRSARRRSCRSSADRCA
jgi:flagellar biosynthetic protein FlhF